MPHKVSKRTIIRKICDGAADEGITMLGRGATMAGMVRPLLEYLKGRGVEVKE